MKKAILIAITASLLASSVAWPQERKQTTRVYQVKWRNAVEIMNVLVGFVGARFSTSDAFNTITVTTDPDVDQTLFQNLIQKYDVPARTVEFQFYLIKATAAGEGLKDGLPDRIRKVINEVAALTRFKSFELLDSPVVRASEGKEIGVSGKGAYFYSLDLGGRGVSIVTTDEKRQQIMVDKFGVHFSIPTSFLDPKAAYRDVGVWTSLSLGDGETIVVGASQIQGHSKEPAAAIITVVTGKIVG
jgi:hypothetical protein